jgi:hypothetical protein
MNVFINIGAKLSSSLGSSVGAAERRFAQMNRKLRVMSVEMSGHLANVEKRWGKFGQNLSKFNSSVSLPAAALTAVGGKLAYDFAKVGNELQGVTEMSDAARKSIERVARAMPGNVVQNLQAGLDLGRSGFSSQAIEGALPTTVKLARSEPGMTTGDASDIATNIMLGMNLPMRTAKEAADNLGFAADRIAYAAAKSSSTIHLVGDSFKYAGPLASRVGINIDQLSAIFMTMADAGIKGSESGVAFRSMIVRMLRPTKAASAMLNRLGIDLGSFVTVGRKLDATGVIKTLQAQGINATGQGGQIQALLNDKKLMESPATLSQRITDVIVNGLGEAAGAMDRDKIAEGVLDALTSGADKVDAFGLIKAMKDKGATTADILSFVDTRQGARLATLFGDQLATNLQDVQKNSGGFLDRQFKQANKGVVGSFQRLEESFGNLMIAMGESGAVDAAADVMDRIARFLTNLGKTNPGALRAFTFAIIGIAAFGPAATVLTGIAAGIGLLGGALELMGVGAAGGIALRAIPGLLSTMRMGLMLTAWEAGPAAAGITGVGTAMGGLGIVPFAAIAAGVIGVTVALAGLAVGVGFIFEKLMEGKGANYARPYTDPTNGQKGTISSMGVWIPSEKTKTGGPIIPGAARGAAGPKSVTLSPTFQIQSSDPPAVRREVERYMDRLAAGHRGALSD